MGFRIAWKDEAILHIARHGLDSEDVDAAMRRRYYFRNHAAGVLVIGRCDGRTIVIVLAPSRTHPGSWEVITARDAEPSEKRLFIRRVKGFR